MEIRQITWAELEVRLEAQGVPYEHYAFKCAHCGHVQSPVSLAKHMSPDAALQAVYSACEGCFTKLSFRKKQEVGCSCRLIGNTTPHKLEVLKDGAQIPIFEPASAEEAQELMQKSMPFVRRCRVCGCDNFHACPRGCYWIEEDLCSACEGKG